MTWRGRRELANNVVSMVCCANFTLRLYIAFSKPKQCLIDFDSLILTWNCVMDAHFLRFKFQSNFCLLKIPDRISINECYLNHSQKIVRYPWGNIPHEGSELPVTCAKNDKLKKNITRSSRNLIGIRRFLDDRLRLQRSGRLGELYLFGGGSESTFSPNMNFHNVFTIRIISVRKSSPAYLWNIRKNLIRFAK